MPHVGGNCGSERRVPGAGYNAAADTITGTMRYHQGDDIPIVGTVIEG